MPSIHDLEKAYTRYARYEKGHQLPTIKQTLRLMKAICAHSRSNQIKDLSTALIRDYLQRQREEKGWSAKTFRLYRQYFKTFFDWRVSQEWIRDNPVTPIKLPRMPIPLPRCLTQKQALRFLSYTQWHPWRYRLEGPRNKAIIATFLRLSELINLRLVDVELGIGELRITHGKNEKERVLALHPQLIPILREYRHIHQQEGQPSIWFFPSVKSAKRLTVKNLHHIFYKISAATGLKVTPHMLRHTFGRLSVESNINMRVIQGMMGHTNIQTTQLYTHVSTKAMKDALKDANFF